MIFESDRKKRPFGGKLVMSEESGVYYIAEKGDTLKHFCTIVDKVLNYFKCLSSKFEVYVVPFETK